MALVIFVLTVSVVTIVVNFAFCVLLAAQCHICEITRVNINNTFLPVAISNAR